MLGRPKNRRKLERRRWRLPAINWRALGVVLGVPAALAGGALASLWVLNQPIESVGWRAASSVSPRWTSSAR